MGIFDFRKKGATRSFGQAEEPKGPAVIVDVRESPDYSTGHIPGSKNIPLMMLSGLSKAVPDMDSLVHVYGKTVAESAKAVKFLEKLGYRHVKDLGSIDSYEGELEK